MTHRGTRALGLVLMTATIWLGAGCSYNKFTTQEEAIKAQWAQVENQLQRRNDLIPNLVETVKGFAAQEQTVIKDVTDARAKMAGAATPADKIAAANAETSALSRLLVVVENYPNLKSDAQFMNLQTELAGTENRLATERMRYNEAVQAYQTATKKFPGNITAKMFGFKDHPYWEVPADAKGVPKVDFGRGRGGGM
ncbi:MAG TPA: LemA family protein [Vicinamibacterales bacterium]|nr:LemA family protein [Vicinamibacterales bacterium]